MADMHLDAALVIVIIIISLLYTTLFTFW